MQLETVLRELSRVPGHRQLDELPIPYRAVAIDLVTGKAVIFNKSLALFVTTDTPIGPVYFGYGRAADGQGSFYC